MIAVSRFMAVILAATAIALLVQGNWTMATIVALCTFAPIRQGWS